HASRRRSHALFTTYGEKRACSRRARRQGPSSEPRVGCVMRPTPAARAEVSKANQAYGDEEASPRSIRDASAASGRRRRGDAAVAPDAGTSDREEVAGAGIGRRVAQLRHRPGLDLADPLTREVEVLPHLLERPRLAPVEAEAQREDLTLALVERREQL